MFSFTAMLPTYNEAENIEKMINELLSIRNDSAVLVVDDMSPDGTGQIVDKLAKEYPGRVFVIHRGGARGRGTAGIVGFKYCRDLDTEFILEMDADFSHEPKYIPELLKAAEGYDVVIGSRFVKGGGEEGRSLIRRLISRSANFYLRVILGIKVCDCTSGYRLFRRKVLKDMNLDNFKSKGPSIVEEVLFSCKKMNCCIKETPIIFRDRARGTSKLNTKLLFDTLLFAVKLRLKG